MFLPAFPRPGGNIPGGGNPPGIVPKPPAGRKPGVASQGRWGNGLRWVRGGSSILGRGGRSVPNAVAELPAEGGAEPGPPRRGGSAPLRACGRFSGR